MEEIAQTLSRKWSFRLKKNSLTMPKRESVIKFKPLAQNNFILENKEKFTNAIAKPLPVILMKSQNEKDIKSEEKYIYNVQLGRYRYIFLKEKH